MDWTPADTESLKYNFTLIKLKRDRRGSEKINFINEIIKRNKEIAVNDQFTPLLWASYYGKIETLNLLLDTNNPHPLHLEGEKDNQGATALLLAVANDQLPVLQILLNHKANMGVMDNQNKTILIYAAMNDSHESFQRMIKEGLFSPQDYQHKDQEGQTFLHAAARRGHFKILKILEDFIKDGPFISRLVAETDNQNRTPLHLATGSGNIELVKWLIKNDADVGALDIDNKYPLHFAIENGYLPIVNILCGKMREKNIPIPKFAEDDKSISTTQSETALDIKTKQQFRTWSDELQQKNDQLDKLSKKLSNETAEKDRLHEKIAALKEAQEIQKKQHATKETELQQKDNQLDKLTEKLSNETAEKNRLLQEIATLKEAREMQRRQHLIKEAEFKKQHPMKAIKEVEFRQQEVILKEEKARLEIAQLAKTMQDQVNYQETELKNLKQELQKTQEEWVIFNLRVMDLELAKGKLSLEERHQNNLVQFASSPNAYIYYEAIQKRMEDLFLSAKAVSGGSVKVKGATLSTVASVIELAGCVLPIPGVGNIINAAVKGGVGFVLNTLDETRQTHIAEEIARKANLFEFQKATILVAERLTLWYCPQLERLATPDQEQAFLITSLLSKISQSKEQLSQKIFLGSSQPAAEAMAALAVKWIYEELQKEGASQKKKTSLINPFSNDDEELDIQLVQIITDKARPADKKIKKMTRKLTKHFGSTVKAKVNESGTQLEDWPLVDVYLKAGLQDPQHCFYRNPFPNGKINDDHYSDRYGYAKADTEKAAKRCISKRKLIFSGQSTKLKLQAAHKLVGNQATQTTPNKWQAAFEAQRQRFSGGQQAPTSVAPNSTVFNPPPTSAPSTSTNLTAIASTSTSPPPSQP